MELEEFLLEENLITIEKLTKVHDTMESLGMTLSEAIIADGIMTEEELSHAIARELKIPYIDLSTYDVDVEACKLINEKIARKDSLLPISIEDNKLLVAMSDPLDILAIDDVRITTGMSICVAISSKLGIERAISHFYNSAEETEKAVYEFNQQSDVDEMRDAVESADIENAPVVRVVKSIILDAFKSKTSDIHIEPFERVVRVRYRVDGELKEVMTLPKSIHSGIITRIKIIGEMDISERKIPQDGRIGTVLDNREIDMRISIIPTVYGEKVVIRLLDKNSVVATKDSLGFTNHNLELLEKLIKVPEGMILLTGPTGSGKTTTLYAVLKELNSISRNIITLEDPVEYRLDGVNQVQVNNKVGMTFAGGLRSILRQDPDVVMLGEIRDEETAKIAIRAAITGHVVLSTLHTNDTASTISRLIDMNIEKYMVSSAVVGIIAQRLIKKICPKCKERYVPSLQEMVALKLEKPQYLYRGKGCHYCNSTGYSGRTAIHEILVLDRGIRVMINNERSIDEIKTEAQKGGMTTLSESARELVLQGITTTEQMQKITYNIDS